MEQNGHDGDAQAKNGGNQGFANAGGYSHGIGASFVKRVKGRNHAGDGAQKAQDRRK